MLQCGAMTQMGQPCTREVNVEGNRCWAHRPDRKPLVRRPRYDLTVGEGTQAALAELGLMRREIIIRMGEVMMDIEAIDRVINLLKERSGACR